MCSVVGYVGKNFSRSFVMEGLTRLEYRGTIRLVLPASSTGSSRYLYQVPGGVSNLLKNFEKSPIDGYVGMGHTRWSTHGVISTENAHPHFDCHKTISIVHNGIIENYHELEQRLRKKGICFTRKQILKRLPSF